MEGYKRWINHGEWEIPIVDDEVNMCDDIDGLLNNLEILHKLKEFMKDKMKMPKNSIS